MRIKSLLIFLFIFPLFNVCYAQSDFMREPYSYIIVDTSFVECVYYHELKDPHFRNKRSAYEILEVGEKYSKYDLYGLYEMDSFYVSNGIVKLPHSQFEAMYMKKVPNERCGELMKDFRKSELTHINTILGETYRYREPIPEFEWTIHADEVKPLCGHLCTKATASFRGRDWTAWFTEEIPVDNGPWKFNGLPGLILMVSDSENQHLYEVIQIRKSNRGFGPRDRKKLWVMDVDRKKYNKEKMDFTVDPLSLMNASGLLEATPPKVKKRRLFYVPLERD